MSDLPDYRHILREEFEMRAARRARYSLRAFAKSLGVSPAHLSEVLNRRKALSEAAALRIGETLGWSKDRTRFFANLVRYEVAATDEVKASVAQELRAQSQEPPFHAIPGEALSDGFRWFHMAIPDLFSLRTFTPNVRWIAAKLRITVVEVEGALAWLRHNGIVEGVGEGLRRRVQSFVLRSPDPEQVKRIYRASLDTAKSALANQSFAVADFGVVTLSFDPKLWPEAIAKIRTLQADLARMSAPGTDDAVYQLGTQFFRLDNPDV